MTNPVAKLVTSARKRLNVFRGPVSVARRRGARWVLDKANWIDARLLAGKPFEDAQLARFVDRLAAKRFDAMLDVGANFGLYAVTAAVNGVPETHAFEPVRRNHNQLSANIFANRADATITAHRVAASDKAGRATIHVAPASSGVSRLDLAGVGDAADAGQFTAAEDIETVRLDDLFAWSGRAVFAKVDVEGHEIAALAGMENLLRNNDVELQVEVFEPNLVEIRAFLGRLGYRDVDRIENDFYFATAAD